MDMKHDRERFTILDKMLNFSDRELLESARAAYSKLLDSLHKAADIKILVAYGGGKDSSFTVFFIRLLQLLLYRDKHILINLRIVTNRHAAMSIAVMNNIDNIYKSLGLYGDPSIELLLVDNMEVKPFYVREAIPLDLVHKNRTDILFNGHKFRGDGRSTFCNTCNLSMMNAFGLGCSYGDGVDVIVTGDSPSEQKEYVKWVSVLNKNFNHVEKMKIRSFREFLHVTDMISKSYTKLVMSSAADDFEVSKRRVTNDISKNIIFFSIYEYTKYESGAHWDILTQLLNFKFDDMMFAFSESDCGNPYIMAHLRGIKVERVYRGSYEDGVLEYVKFALEIMHIKQFPDMLISKMEDKFQIDRIGVFRANISQYAYDTYSLTTENLITLCYSPFTDGGKYLECWINNEYVHLLPEVPMIHRVLGLGVHNSQITNFLEQKSGLPIDHIRSLYNSMSVPSLLDSNSEGNPLTYILRNDPHKKIIKTLDNVRNRVLDDIISGR